MIGFRVGKILRQVRDAVGWAATGLAKSPRPDSGVYKIRRLRQLGEEHGLEHLIETGTFYGQTISALIDDFRLLTSIEIYEPLYAWNVSQFKDTSKVAILRGDSGEKLGAAIDIQPNRVLFWLDGHYSGAGTGQGKVFSPVLSELAQIKNKAGAPYAVVIDDIRLFGTDPGYPQLSELLSVIGKFFNHRLLYIDSDALVFFVSE